MNRLPLALLFAAAMSAQQPNVTNVSIDTRSAASGLEEVLRPLLAESVTPAWVGYSAPSVGGAHNNCCDCGQGCCNGAQGGHTVQLEGPSRLTILFRAENRQVVKIRFLDEGCRLDAGGLPLHWLNAVRAADSIQVLSRYASRDPESHEVAETAITAIALHADPEADRVLESFAAPGHPFELRKRALFWLGVSRGHKGAEVLESTLHNDPDDRIREHAIFALSLSHEPQALGELIRAAHGDRSGEVRGKALFWLAQQASKRVAAEAIENAIDNDPDTRVKEQAVFALSQLPPDDGIPKLIHVASTNRNREVRKKAMFWLGQSHDPRALAFIEHVLTSN